MPAKRNRTRSFEWWQWVKTNGCKYTHVSHILLEKPAESQYACRECTQCQVSLRDNMIACGELILRAKLSRYGRLLTIVCNSPCTRIDTGSLDSSRRCSDWLRAWQSGFNPPQGQQIWGLPSLLGTEGSFLGHKAARAWSWPFTVRVIEWARVRASSHSPLEGEWPVVVKPILSSKKRPRFKTRKHLERTKKCGRGSRQGLNPRKNLMARTSSNLLV
jgi:hypothetical protein